MANTKIQSEQIVDDVALGGNPTTTTQSAGNDTTRVATTAFVTTAVSNLVDSAPSSLNTLNELAAAMNDNASFFSTVLPLSGGTMTGGLVLGGTTPTLTIGDAGAEDTAIVFDGNAQDFYIGLDDSADDLVIGLGSAVGTTPAIVIDEGLKVGIGVTPSGSWDANIDALQVGEQSVFRAGDTDYTDSTVMATNLYQTGGTNKYITTGFGSSYTQQGGTHFWGTAPSGSADNTATEVEIFRANASGGITVNNDQNSNINFIAKAGSSANAFQIDGSSGSITINEAGVNADFRVESDGNANMLFVDGGNNKVLLGSTAARSQASVTPAFQIEGTDFNSSSLGLVSNSNGSTGAFIVISHNRGTSVGSSTAVNNGDRIGGIWFQAGDGTDIESTVAYMEANIYGDVGSNDTPGLLKFGTTADGSASPTERLAILPSGGITFNGDRSTANALDDYEEGTFTPTLYGYNGNTISVGGTFNGFYTKIGRLVNIILYAETVTFNSGVSSNYIQISMPFSAHGGSNMLTNAYGAGSFTSHNMDFAHEHSAPSFLTTTTMGFLGSNQDGGGWAWEDWSTVGTNAYWRISMTYMTA